MATSPTLSAHTAAGLLHRLPTRPGSRYLALADELTSLLHDGRVVPGTRLPSERELARRLGLSRSTTTAAFDELDRRGLLDRRRGAGSFLRLPDGASVGRPASRISPTGQHADLIDLSIAARRPVSGMISAALSAVVSENSPLLVSDGYFPYGIDELRIAVATGFAERGVPTDPDQILVTNGAQSALDLLLRRLGAPGDRVLVESPTYPGALDAIAAHHLRPVGVALARTGDPDAPAHTEWDLATMRNALRQSAPRMAYLIPDFHNPTGALIDAEQRRALTSAARGSSTQLVVDESFVELDLREGDPEPVPPMAGFNPDVITIGSLSKPFWGGLRVGWIRARSDLVHELAAVRARTDLAGAVLEQLVALQLLRRRDELRHQRVRALRQGRQALLDALADRLPGWRSTAPAGGMSLWVELDQPSATPLSLRAEQLGVLLTPGSRFAVEPAMERYLRLPYSLSPDELTEAVRRIALAWEGLDHGVSGRYRSRLIAT